MAKAPAKPMTKAQIVDHLASKLDTPKKTAQGFLDELAQLTYKEAKKDFTLPGIGKVVMTKRKKRQGRNPSTGESITIPAKNVVKIRPSKALKDATEGTQKQTGK